MRPNPRRTKCRNPRHSAAPEITTEASQDARVKLAEWITAKDNPFFARSFVNRVWRTTSASGL